MARTLALTPNSLTVAQRGRMITADHVLALLPEKRSRWWVLTSFAPDKKQKLGKMVYWWEADIRDVLYIPDELPKVRRGEAA